MRIFFPAFLFFFCFHSSAQTSEWWVNTVKWDGITHWSRYIITQPAYMGPNALPVPRIGNGNIDTTFFIGATANFHFSNGDNTQNPTLYANYCFAKGIISMDASWVPYEHYSMSHAIKTERRVFYIKYYDDNAKGDIHLNTNIQVLNKWRKHIQLALRIGFRFPAGGDLETARFSDGSGYYFDISYGKPFGNSHFKWIGMAGFYTWQLNQDRHRQDDAFLFGNGIEYDFKSWKWQTYVAGYLGYLRNSGDKPIVARASVEKRLKRMSLLFGFQQGLHDFKYSSGEIGAKYCFRKN